MQYAMIGTWKMACEGIAKAAPLLKAGAPLTEVIGTAVRAVEDNPAYHSVGFSGLPNRECVVELDASYMDGDTLGFGGVMGVHQIQNPIDVAIDLCGKDVNCLLCGTGAEQYAQHRGFAFRNLLTPETIARWEQERQNLQKEELKAYDGHDTVCMIAKSGPHMATGVSTSGLFMKHPGRVGDSPIIGSGFYCDSKSGGAVCTGMGEDVMRGCLAYEVVRRMEQGVHPQQACEAVVAEHLERRLRPRGTQDGCLGVLAMNAEGEFGVSTNLPEFAFAVYTETLEPQIWVARKQPDGSVQVAPATQEWLDQPYDFD